MKKVLNRLLLITCIFFGLILIQNKVEASSDLLLKSLDYDVTLNADGSANVIETWKIRIDNTNTLFKNFEIDSSKYKEITDVQVSEITSSGEVKFNKTNQYKYHVDKNYYYALMNERYV